MTHVRKVQVTVPVDKPACDGLENKLANKQTKTLWASSARHVALKVFDEAETHPRRPFFLRRETSVCRDSEHGSPTCPRRVTETRDPSSETHGSVSERSHCARTAGSRRAPAAPHDDSRRLDSAARAAPGRPPIRARGPSPAAFPAGMLGGGRASLWVTRGTRAEERRTCRFETSCAALAVWGRDAASEAAFPQRPRLGVRTLPGHRGHGVRRGFLRL